MFIQNKYTSNFRFPKAYFQSPLAEHLHSENRHLSADRFLPEMSSIKHTHLH